ncbi:putative glycosyltransferase [Rivularia sp. PCC 7116]|uniref:glycosyltransferase family 2 protein n=1 Tax=Rivularia sp. PCC 7116 TaxID=373994 RepID=UPI00029F29CC|nr:glycosyltransferase [Rivularia sp. PCC 7116]AFY59183.1 putative glycosyltransferase [Rivularia sp. PCC 7116]
MSYPKVTLVVVPHECFQYTEESLESIYKYTNVPFKLIYIDGYSPNKIRQYIEAKSQEKGFSLIRTDKYVSSNQARNIGLKYVDTEYVVFLNNDVLVTAGWLNKLMHCIEETNASVVSPICLQATSYKPIIHSAGGTLEFQYRDGSLDLFDRRLFIKKSFDQVQPLLKRHPTQIVDFSCVLVRTAIFRQIGSFDENLMNFAQGIDFSLSVFAAGGTIYLESESIVSYLKTTELKLSDIPYYLLIWNYVWKRKSIHHFQEKWGLAKNAKFITDALQQLNYSANLTFQPLKELIKPFYDNENYAINPRVFKRS